MNDSNKNKKEILTVIGLILIFVLIIGVTYAAFTYTGKGSRENTVTTGTVGLMYPSDWGYTFVNGVHSGCYNTPSNISNCGQTNAQNSWLFPSSHTNWHEWLLTPQSDDSEYAFLVNNNGIITKIRTLDSSMNNISIEVRPVVYLKSNAKITGGQGTSESPYTLG